MMNAMRPTPEYDFSTLQDEIAGYRTLVALLHKEQDALRRADADAIPGIVATKQRDVQSLIGVASSRARALRHADFEATRAAAEMLLVRQGADPAAVGAAWSELEVLVNDAQRLNAINGILIEAQQSYFSRALAALSRAAGTPAGYGADGRPQFGLGSRILAAI
jgi:flagellar biosynthesis/type III secretory pathway chaperone